MKSNRNRISMLVFIGIALVVFRFLFYLETLNVNIESLLGICLIMSMSVITVKKENISLEIIFWRCSWCRFVHDKIMGFLPNKNRRNELLPQIFGRIVINGDIPIPYFSLVDNYNGDGFQDLYFEIKHPSWYLDNYVHITPWILMSKKVTYLISIRSC